MSISSQRKMSLSQFARDTERADLINGLVIRLMVIGLIALTTINIILDPPRFSVTEEILGKLEQRSIVVKDSYMPVEILNYKVTRTDDGSYNSHYQISSDNYEKVNRFEIWITRYDSWRNRYVDYKTMEIIGPDTKDGLFKMIWGYDLSKDREYTHIIYIKKVKLQSGEVFRLGNPPLDMLK